ncbi:MAG: lipopolysaccharide biosynthesis protein [Planctomycetota bacterium]
MPNTVSKTISDIIGQARGPGLKAKITRASMALLVGTFVGRGIRFVRYMILARLLAPDEFGLMAIIMFVTMAFEAFTEVGVKQSIIQNKRGADPEYLNVAWWMKVIRGFGLFLIAIVIAPWISSFYDKPQLLGLLRVSLFSILFRGLVSPRAHVLEKEYKFNRAVILVQGSSILGTAVTIILAFVLRNVWALVIAFVVESAILCLLSYILVPIVPRFRIDRESLRELMRFARGIFGLPVLTMIAFGADVLVLGKVVSEKQLGMYSLAVDLAYLPMDLFARIIHPILLPTFSQKQNDRNSLCRAALQITRGTAIFGVPLVGFIISCAGGILLLAYGQKYVAVAIPFSILCLGIIARTEASIMGSIYFAVGQPHLHRRFVTMRAVITVGLIYPAAVYFGLWGAACVVVLANFSALLMQVFWCRRVIGLKFSNYAWQYVPGILLTLPIIVIVSLLRLFGVESPILMFFVGGFLFLVVSAAGIYIVKYSNESFTIQKGSAAKSNDSPSVGVKSV